mmetsp:Transcript_4469/g.10391  ORF Transcript_4469/g.10391 Transcript_4469/m.10391 type:complete len:325 (+) Transcript_4469:104-1078(+)
MANVRVVSAFADLLCDVHGHATLPSKASEVAREAPQVVGCVTMLRRDVRVDIFGRQAVYQSVPKVRGKRRDARDNGQQQEVQSLSSNTEHDRYHDPECPALPTGQRQVLGHPSANRISQCHQDKPVPSSVVLKRDRGTRAVRPEDRHASGVEGIEKQWEGVLHDEISQELGKKPWQHGGQPLQRLLQGAGKDLAAFALRVGLGGGGLVIEDDHGCRDARSRVDVVHDHRHAPLLERSQNNIMNCEAKWCAHDGKSLRVFSKHADHAEESALEKADRDASHGVLQVHHPKVSHAGTPYQNHGDQDGHKHHYKGKVNDAVRLQKDQ